eukprot:CAMPEP_0170067020 /NCGR_PEP_ID=MMETSP0019_2-20121128/6529_1 /TAXON_ID=98059 /ORGANISM="Dinobryon sp., Strain UTEXLB2267" /LENGTH=54 /DNA_ID=CAMNT_0010274315 /DNA_START=374 /DNA_END=534 /DNA_ORIENTATION=+
MRKESSEERNPNEQISDNELAFLYPLPDNSTKSLGSIQVLVGDVNRLQSHRPNS